MTADGARVVLGPGTGLGAGALIPARGMWVPVPGEGGHIDLSPVSERDFAIWPNVERTGGRIGAETLLCGSGMVRLYRAVCASDGVQPEFATPKEVTEAGLSGASQQAAETLSLFATHLGRVAGNLALVFMPTGGVFLAGGISAKIAPVLKSGGLPRSLSCQMAAPAAAGTHGHLDRHQGGRGARRHRRLRAGTGELRRQPHRPHGGGAERTQRSAKASLAPSATKAAAKVRRIQASTRGREMT